MPATKPAKQLANELLSATFNIETMRWPWSIERFDVDVDDSLPRIWVVVYFRPSIEVGNIKAGALGKAVTSLPRQRWSAPIRDLLEFAAESLLQVVRHELRRAGHGSLAEQYVQKNNEKLITWI